MEVASVEEWLQVIHLERYHEAFHEAGYDSLETCCQLTEATLECIGILAPGHRARILNHLPSLSNDGEAVYVNTDFWQDASRNSRSIQDRESVYDVPASMVRGDQTYCNVPPPSSDVFSCSESSAPPALPPKQRSVAPNDVDAKLGLTQAASKKPVPMPRRKKEQSPTPSNDSAEGSPEVLHKTANQNSSPSVTPVPKPRPRPRLANRIPTLKLSGATTTESSDASPNVSFCQPQETPVSSGSDSSLNISVSRSEDLKRFSSSSDNSDKCDLSEFHQNLCNELKEKNSAKIQNLTNLSVNIPASKNSLDQTAVKVAVATVSDTASSSEGATQEHGFSAERDVVTTRSSVTNQTDLPDPMRSEIPLRGSKYVPVNLLRASMNREAVENPYSEMWMSSSGMSLSSAHSDNHTKSSSDSEESSVVMRRSRPLNLNLTEPAYRDSRTFDEPPPAFAPPPLPAQFNLPAPAIPPRRMNKPDSPPIPDEPPPPPPVPPSTVPPSLPSQPLLPPLPTDRPKPAPEIPRVVSGDKEKYLQEEFDAAINSHFGADPQPLSPILNRGLSIFEDSSVTDPDPDIFQQAMLFPSPEVSTGAESQTHKSSFQTSPFRRQTDDILASFDPFSIGSHSQPQSVEYACVDPTTKTKNVGSEEGKGDFFKKQNLPKVLPTIPSSVVKPTNSAEVTLEPCQYEEIPTDASYEAIYADADDVPKQPDCKMPPIPIVPEPASRVSQYSEAYGFSDEKVSPPQPPPASGPAVYSDASDLWLPFDQQVRSSVCSKSAPVPPPRGPNPFISLLDIDRGTYCFDDNFSSSHDYEPSEGSLSDGGEYIDQEEFQRHSQIFSKAAVPIVPATPTRSNERSGYLFKLASSLRVATPSPARWHKVWVAFDGIELKYYSHNKKMVSKRIINLATMVNVENTIKTGESHPYRIQLVTRDRIYSFAADDVDDVQLWSSSLMQGIIMYKAPPGGFPEGGDMENPDKMGFLRIDGLKGKRYVVIKGDKLCYYNDVKDFEVASPIHRIEMKLTSVKDVGKMRLQLQTPHTRFIFQLNSQGELLDWMESMKEAIAEGLADDSILQQVYENTENRNCADCRAPDPHWASVNLAVVICSKCAGIHRMLSLPLSKVRSLRMDTKIWTPEVIRLFKVIGNDEANRFWEWDIPAGHKISPDQDMTERQSFIMSKYKERRYCQLHPLYRDQESLNEALCKAVTLPNLFDTMQLLFSGADILCTTSRFGVAGETPLKLAKKSGQTLQMEFLAQNGAEGSGQLPVPSSIQNMSVPPVARVAHTGYMYKTGPNQKDFYRRWCVLEHGIFSYFENESSPVPKDCIENKEMQSIISKTNDKYEHAFELSTTKSGGRVYLFACDASQDRSRWMNKLAKNFAPEAAVSLITEFDGAGYVFLRESAAMDWGKVWIQVFEKQLSIFSTEKKEFEEIDLRKVTNIKILKSGCALVHEHGQMFVVDLPGGRALYIQADMKRDTDEWYSIINKAILDSGGELKDHPLTKEDVPVIVDKCINFVSTHGLKCEGIYRKNGQHSKITQLLMDFKQDARSVHLRPDDHSLHDVANVLKRYFRSLDDPLLCKNLYARFISTVAVSDHNSKLQWYKYLLGEMQTINYSTLKKMVRHLVSVTEQEAENKMGVNNLASIFGPVFMNTDRDSGGGFSNTEQEIGVLIDLLSYHQWLFEVTEEEIEKDKKIQCALEKMANLSSKPSNMVQAGDMLIGVYINNNKGDCVTNKIPATMNSNELLNYVVKKAGLCGSNMGLFEVICNGDLERPLHYLERVLEIVLKWSSWDEEFSKNSYLCVKENKVYDHISYVIEPHLSLFSELKYSEKKGWKKFCFEFSRAQLSYQKDSRALTAMHSWNVEDLIFYMGTEQKRAPPTPWSFTFVVKDETNKVLRNKDTPYFGRSICCNTEEELYRWIAGMLHAQHPEGLLPLDENNMSNMRIHPLEMRPPPPSFNHMPTRNKMSASIKKFLRR